MIKCSLVLAVLTSFYALTQQLNVPNCKTPGVLADGTEVCLDCSDGYYLNSSYSTSICFSCPYRCSKCAMQKATNALVCTDCTEGYRFASSSLTCEACPASCKACTEAACVQCFEGYTLTAEKVCESKSSAALYAFVAAAVLGLAYLLWWVYKTYLRGNSDDPVHQASEMGNYAREKDKEKEVKKVEVGFKGGRRADADNN